MPRTRFAALAAILGLGSLRAETLTFSDPALLGFGKPAIGTAWSVAEPQGFKNASGGLESWDVRALVPVWGGKRDDFAAGLSLSYQHTELKAWETPYFTSLSLENVQAQITLAKLPKTAGWAGLALLRSGVGTDGQAFGSTSFAASAILIGGYQFSPRFSLAAACAIFRDIEETRFLGGLGLLWQPSDHWIVQLTPPIVSLGWLPAEDWRVSLSMYPSGGSWAVQSQNSQDLAALRFSNYRAGLGLEVNLAKHWRITSLVGLNFGSELQGRDSQQRTLFDQKLKSSAFGLLGLSYSF
jgi:hypothetical protein